MLKPQPKDPSMSGKLKTKSSKTLRPRPPKKHTHNNNNNNKLALQLLKLKDPITMACKHYTKLTKVRNEEKQSPNKIVLDFLPSSNKKISRIRLFYFDIPPSTNSATSRARLKYPFCFCALSVEC
jgi:hypothetical protein